MRYCSSLASLITKWYLIAKSRAVFGASVAPNAVWIWTLVAAVRYRCFTMKWCFSRSFVAGCLLTPMLSPSACALKPQLIAPIDSSKGLGVSVRRSLQLFQGWSETTTTTSHCLTSCKIRIQVIVQRSLTYFWIRRTHLTDSWTMIVFFWIPLASTTVYL